jgi:hypothetical protein
VKDIEIHFDFTLNEASAFKLQSVIILEYIENKALKNMVVTVIVASKKIAVYIQNALPHGDWLHHMKDLFKYIFILI